MIKAHSFSLSDVYFSLFNIKSVIKNLYSKSLLGYGVYSIDRVLESIMSSSDKDSHLGC